MVICEWIVSDQGWQRQTQGVWFGTSTPSFLPNPLPLHARQSHCCWLPSSPLTTSNKISPWLGFFKVMVLNCVCGFQTTFTTNCTEWRFTGFCPSPVWEKLSYNNGQMFHAWLKLNTWKCFISNCENSKGALIMHTPGTFVAFCNTHGVQILQPSIIPLYYN